MMTVVTFHDFVPPSRSDRPFDFVSNLTNLAEKIDSEKTQKVGIKSLLFREKLPMERGEHLG
jgi:hypothetical protein